MSTDDRLSRTAELIRVASGNGSYLYFSRPVEEARVIEELQLSLAVKSETAGVEFLARVVLPRSLDPNTGNPVTCLISAGRYSSPGHWQTLRMSGLPLELERQARLLRSRLGPQIETREAYVDQVLVNLYAGPGNSSVLLGELEITGHVGRDLAQDVDAGSGGPPRRRPNLAIGKPRFDRSILLIENRPFFPRSIDYQGEELSFLQRLGFNTIRFKKLPPDDLLDEAARLGLWVIAPPPFGPPVGGNAGPPAEEIAADVYDPVLAWDLGPGLSNVEVPAVNAWAEQIRRWDRDRSRPLVASPISNLRVYSRHLNVLILDRSPLGTSTEMADFVDWVRQRPRLARPGTAVWTSLATQPARALVEQCRALAADGTLDTSFASEQLRLLVHLALTGGSRGLLLASDSRLDGTDLPTRLRAATLELINLELSLVEPWLASGQTAVGVSSTEAKATGAVIQAEQVRILLPVWVEPKSQFVPGHSAGYRLSFLVPGVPKSHEAYELTAAGLMRPKAHYAAGGMRVTLDEFDVTSLVALTQDPLIVSTLDRRLRALPERAVALARELAVAKMMQAAEVDRELGASSLKLPQAAGHLESARKSLAECDRLLGEKKFADAFDEVQRTTRPLRYLERAYWETSVKPLTSPVASPLAATLSTLVAHHRWYAEASRALWMPTPLGEGQFENLERIQRAGWRYFQHTDPTVRTWVGPSPDQPRSGQQSLCLRVTPANPRVAVELIESAPVWITSPAIQVAAGQTLRIRGWVRVPRPITGSIDGLMILDSLTGEALAERIRRTEGWQEFVLYRAVPHSGRFSVTFAMTGLGEAWIDDVQVEVRDSTAPTGPAPPPQVPPQAAAPQFNAPGASPPPPAAAQFGPLGAPRLR
ncbi:MAG: hypothetical protein JNG90_13725 [Planctomycetaceae bacterium]|nr:hypothetical protein [Planctomycetaceae bacterium]